MKNRVEKLRKKIPLENYIICVQKAHLYTESFRNTEGEPMIMRRAKAVAAVLENIDIFIDDNLRNVHEVKSLGIRCFLVSRPWNSGGMKIEEILESLI